MALHPFLQPAVSAAVASAVGEVKGAPAAPTTAELQTLLTQHAALLNQQSAIIQQQQATIAAFPQVLANAIALNNAQFVTPGLQAILGGSLPGSLDTLKELVTQMQADETGATQLLASVNADRARFAQLEPLVAGLGTTLTTLTATVSTKAAAADLTALVATVGTKATSADLGTLASVVAGKALTADLTTTNANLSTLTTTVGGLPASIAQAKQEVKTELLGGAGAAYDTLQELAQLELNAESVTQALTLRVGGVEGLVNNATTGIAALNTALNTKALASDLTALTATVSGKALASDLTATNSNVAANTTAINLRATTASVTAVQANVDTQKGRVDSLLTTTVPALQTGLDNRLRKDVADATPFALGVPAAASMDKAVQKSELAGGIQRPYRIYQNVGATPTGAYLRGTQTAPIMDSLGLGQVYVLASVRVKTITAPALASTISLFRNGSATAFYTQTIALTAIPAVGKILDILSIGTSLPADITLPATITASSSSGTFEIIIDGVLK